MDTFRNLTFLALTIFIASCTTYPYTYMGSDRKGYAISAEQAIEVAKPYLYDSYKLRNPSSQISKKEFESYKYLQTFVYIDTESNFYMVFKDLPKKLASKHFAYPIKVSIFDGEVIKTE